MKKLLAFFDIGYDVEGVEKRQNKKRLKKRKIQFQILN